MCVRIVGAVGGGERQQQQHGQGQGQGQQGLAPPRPIKRARTAPGSHRASSTRQDHSPTSDGSPSGVGPYLGQPAGQLSGHGSTRHPGRERNASMASLDSSSSARGMMPMQQVRRPLPPPLPRSPLRGPPPPLCQPPPLLIPIPLTRRAPRRCRRAASCRRTASTA
jgi:hypothetical protein